MKVIRIKIPNSFIVEVRFSKIQKEKSNVTVFGIDETFNYYNYVKSNIYENINRLKEVVKSKHKVFRKIEGVLEDTLNHKLQSSFGNHLCGLYEFFEVLISYNNLFTKKCFSCKRISKFEI